MFEELTQAERNEIKDLLKKSGSSNKEQALAAQNLIAAQLSTPIRQGVLTGSIVSDIFERTVFDPNARIEYPVDFFRPDNDGEFTAYVMPNEGAIPQRHVEGDYVSVPTYDVGNSIDWLIRYTKEARFDVVGRGLEVLEAGHIKKNNDDAFHTILSAAVDRNILVSDANASNGQFTKRLISQAKLIMRRNAGGNSASLNRGRLTHIYLSPEAIEDMRNWGLDEIDDVTRREIFLAEDGTFNRVFQVTLVDLDELGEGQEYQDYYTNTLGASMASNDVEIAVGLDLGSRDSFVNPVREELEIFEDDMLHRNRRQGFYSWASHGWGILDNRKLLLLSQ